MAQLAQASPDQKLVSLQRVTKSQKTPLESIAIPRIIHQTWETLEVPVHMKRAVESWIEKNPTWTHCFHDDSTRRTLIHKHFSQRVLDAYDNIVPGAFRADLWRLCVLYVEGGVYTDVDTVSVVPLDDFLGGETEFCTSIDLNPAHLYNTFIASVPKHPFLWETIQRIIRNVETRYYGCKEFGFLEISGPAALGHGVNVALGRPVSNQFVHGSQILGDHKVSFLFFGGHHTGLQDPRNGRLLLDSKYEEYDTYKHSQRTDFGKMWEYRKAYRVRDTLRGRVYLEAGEVHSIGTSDVELPTDGTIHIRGEPRVVADRLTAHRFLVTLLPENSLVETLSLDWEWVSEKDKADAGDACDIVPARKVVDGCMMLNELHILKWRLRELRDVVDHFIVVESNETHSGIAKPFHLERDRNEFSSDPLTYVQLRENPKETWERERFGRYSIVTEGLSQLDLADTDLVVISDLDEVIDPAFLEALRRSHLRTTLQIDTHWFNFRWSCYLGVWGNKITVSTYGDLKRQVKAGWRGSRSPEDTLDGTYFPDPAGWHASYFTTPKGVLDKLGNVAPHGNKEKVLGERGEAFIRNLITQGRGELYGYRETRTFLESLPKYASMAEDFRETTQVLSGKTPPMVYWIDQDPDTVWEHDFIGEIMGRVWGTGWEERHAFRFLSRDEAKLMKPPHSSVMVVSTSSGGDSTTDDLGQLIHRWKPLILFQDLLL